MSERTVHISVISPVYKAEKMVDLLVEEICKHLSRITDSFEIILVEDGSPDDSWAMISKNCERNAHVRGVKLSRNFGQHHAITAGLDVSKGEWVVVMDCDLQDRPEEIPRLFAKAQEGFEIVYARRVVRQDKFLKKFTSKLFFKAFSYLSGIEQDGTIGNFGIYNRKCIKAINAMREPMRAFFPMARWVGFKRTAIDVKHGVRHEGETTYSWRKLINLALNIAVAYSEKPLKIAVTLGLSISLISILYAIYIAFAYVTGQITLTGWASLIISVWLLSGLIIFVLGIVGLYVGKSFEGIKGRPLYLIDETIN